MKRDMELVRLILITVGDSDEGVYCEDGAFASYPRDLVAYHFEIMDEAGLIDAMVESDMSQRYAIAIANKLTWYGNDFLDSIKSDSVWGKIKNAIGKTVGSASIEVIAAVASRVASDAILSAI